MRKTDVQSYSDDETEYIPDVLDSDFNFKLNVERNSGMLNIASDDFGRGKFKQVDYSCKRDKSTNSLEEGSI